MTPGGFAIALHINFSAPQFLFQTFPQEWVEYYSDQGLQLHDPAVRWGFANNGFVRWRDLINDDPREVIAKARDHGLTYGMTISIFDNNSRSVCGFAHPDRDYLDAEVEEIEACLLKLHRATLGVTVLSQADIAALKKMSIRLSHS